MYSRISSLSIPFWRIGSRNSAYPNALHCQCVRSLHHSAGLRASVKNIQQVKDAFTQQAVEENAELLSLKDAKKFLHQLGFKRHGENYFGPKGMQAHVDMGTSKGHGDHLDLTQKGWEKIKVKVDPNIRLE